MEIGQELTVTLRLFMELTEFTEAVNEKTPTAYVSTGFRHITLTIQIITFLFSFRLQYIPYEYEI